MRSIEGYPYTVKAKLTRCIIWGQRLIFSRFLHSFSSHAPIPYSFTGDAANQAISELLLSPSPCMVARFGAGEMETTLRHLDIVAPGGALVKTMKMCVGQSGPFWWDNSILAGMTWIAGLFPPAFEMLDRFGHRAVEDSREIDFLASWLAGEKRLQRQFFPNVKSFPLEDLEPFWSATPWSAALKGKTVLLVHPFEKTIQMQYEKRHLLFKDPNVLPDFTLKTYKTVSSLGGNKVPFRDWFEALDYMCNGIAQIPFDIAIVGAGAYGMSIAAFIKRELRRKVVHMGGATQLLFGIKGNRWDQRPKWRDKFYNEHWARPLPEETITRSGTVEGSAYW